MYNKITPLHLGRRFPCSEIMLFGKAVKEEDYDNQGGHVAINVKFPRQADMLALEIDGINLWKTYVPSDAPDLSEISFDFRRTRAAAEAKLVNPIVASNPDLDVFYVEEGNLIFLRQEGNGYRMFNSNLLYQALDLYSRLLRKSISALRREENRAVRNLACELSSEMKTEQGIRRIDLETKLKDVFIRLVMDILNERE